MDPSNFVKEEKLGAGAFGVVYRVRSKRSNKLYVIKEQQMNSTVVMNEVKVLKKIGSHPNVVAYHGSWLENGKGCILMEYASQGSLEQFMQRLARPLSEEDALYLFAQIVSGVNHIHRQSIIHRDLKPANVMIHRTLIGGKHMDIIKIGDFGISKDTGVSIARTAIGTKIYMAPETFRGSVYGFKCDMWSCGIILYELLTNDFPFKAWTVSDMMEKIKRGRVARITSGNISQSTLSMTYKLISVNPDERPRSTHLVRLPVIAKWNRNIRQFLNGNSTSISGHTSGRMPITELLGSLLSEEDCNCIRCRES